MCLMDLYNLVLDTRRELLKSLRVENPHPSRRGAFHVSLTWNEDSIFEFSITNSDYLTAVEKALRDQIHMAVMFPRLVFMVKKISVNFRLFLL